MAAAGAPWQLAAGRYRAPTGAGATIPVCPKRPKGALAGRPRAHWPQARAGPSPSPVRKSRELCVDIVLGVVRPTPRPCSLCRQPAVRRLAPAPVQRAVVAPEAAVGGRTKAPIQRRRRFWLSSLNLLSSSPNCPSSFWNCHIDDCINKNDDLLEMNDDVVKVHDEF